MDKAAAVFSDGEMRSWDVMEKTFNAPEHLHSEHQYYFFVIKHADRPIKIFKWTVWNRKGRIDYGFDTDKNAKNLLAETGAVAQRRLYTLFNQ